MVIVFYAVVYVAFLVKLRFVVAHWQRGSVFTSSLTVSLYEDESDSEQSTDGSQEVVDAPLCDV